MEDGLQGVRFFEFLTEEEREEFAEAWRSLVSLGAGEEHHRGGRESRGACSCSPRARSRSGRALPGGGSRASAAIDASRGRTVVGEKRGFSGRAGRPRRSWTVVARSRR